MGSAESYFRYARDAAFVDMVGHQGNDFQITDAFWKELNRLTAEFDEPGSFVCLPGYEWSGNTGMGGDRNIFYRHEGRPIRRSSHILVEGQTSTDAIYTADELFRALEGEDAVVIAHVGGRYADIKYAHDGRLERAVEVHSTWGTFEWLLHDAFEKGYRVGVVCHSDDHKGRPGATRPGASTFGAIGGLTCYFMPELTRDALFEALRQRRHYGTTGTRLFLDLRGTFDAPVTGFSDDPQLGARAGARRARGADGRHHPAGLACRCGLRPRSSAPRRSSASTCCTARRWCKRCARSPPPISAAACACCGRAPNIAAAAARRIWQGKLTLAGNRFARFAPVNFLNPERKVQETAPGTALAWTSVTTGNLAGIDLWLDEAAPRHARHRNQRRVGRGRSCLARRRHRHVRRRRARPQAQRLSPARSRLEPARHARAHGDVLGRRRPAGLCPRHAGRRPSGLVEPDLPDRIAALPAPPVFDGNPTCARTRLP